MRVIIFHLAGVLVAACGAILPSAQTFLFAAYLGMPIFALPAVLLMFGLVYLVGTLSPDAARLCARRWPRAAWAAIVTAPGCVASVLTFAVLNSLGAGSNALVSVLVLAVPFPLIAATLTTSLLTRIAGAVLLAVLVWLGIQLPGAAPSFVDFWHAMFAG